MPKTYSGTIKSTIFNDIHVGALKCECVLHMHVYVSLRYAQFPLLRVSKGVTFFYAMTDSD